MEEAQPQASRWPISLYSKMLPCIPFQISFTPFPKTFVVFFMYSAALAIAILLGSVFQAWSSWHYSVTFKTLTQGHCPSKPTVKTPIKFPSHPYFLLLSLIFSNVSTIHLCFWSPCHNKDLECLPEASVLNTWEQPVMLSRGGGNLRREDLVEGNVVTGSWRRSWDPIPFLSFFVIFLATMRGTGLIHPCDPPWYSEPLCDQQLNLSAMDR